MSKIIKQITLKDDCLMQLLGCLEDLRNDKQNFSTIFRAGMLYQYISDNIEELTNV